jgi:hypothetical protein
LRRVVEFLNGQMNPAEVTAIEVKQYLSSDGTRTLVPRVIGQTAEVAAVVRSGAAGMSSLFAELEVKRGEDETRAARDLFDWAVARGWRPRACGIRARVSNASRRREACWCQTRIRGCT